MLGPAGAIAEAETDLPRAWGTADRMLCSAPTVFDSTDLPINKGDALWRS